MPRRILVVDDEASVAGLIRAILEEEGYVVAVACDGARGMAMAREWRPDLILMDVQLPRVDGGTAIRGLKGEPATRAIPIVAMSAGRNLLERTGDLDQADGALAKPFDVDALLAQVAFHLRRSAAAAED